MAQNGGTLRSSTDFTYADKTNYLTGVKHVSPLGTQNIGYTYGDINQGQMPDQVYKVSWNGQERLNFIYDPLGRLNTKTILVGGGVPDAPKLTTEYTYYDVGTDKTTTLVQSVQTELGTFNYTYDAVGNITETTLGEDSISYAYDALNQLVRENNSERGWTITYDYQNGNITEMRMYEYTTGSLEGMPYEGLRWSYTDSTWGDLLTDFAGISGVNGEQGETVSAYASPRAMQAAQTVFADTMLGRALQSRTAQSGGIRRMNAANPLAFTYDEIGNPTSMLGIQLSWSGRQLQQVTERDSVYSYQYNTDGQRVSKTVNGVKTEFFYNGSVLAGQKTGDNTLVFMYDNNGDIFGVVYNDAEYYYVKNAQNDVVAISDSDKNIVAKYFYTAYGVVSEITDANGNDISYKENHIANVNPILYRSYYYDSETYFYYLNTRYYSPELCRFLNADGYAQTGQGLLDKNMFAYCGNNPVNRSDLNGNKWADVKQWFSDKWSAVKSWANSMFGVQNLFTVSASSPQYNEYGVGISGSYSSTVADKADKKPITFYKKWSINTKKRVAMPTPSYGIQIQTAKISASIDFDWTSCSASASIARITSNGMTQGYSLNFALDNISLSSDATREIDAYTSETYSTNIDISTMWIFAVAVFVESGVLVPVPEPAGGLQPAY